MPSMTKYTVATAKTGVFQARVMISSARAKPWRADLFHTQSQPPSRNDCPGRDLTDQPPEKPMTRLPVDRALNIYGALADPEGVRERLSQHLMQRYIEGERDQHRLTVEGLSYLQRLYRELDSRE